ncbi:MAG: hypothetical protein GXP10_10695 [Gammaproteobacteria bacterium]|nr:hypothetical protein [Gammaproteobacteria bacterium]
MTTDKEKNRKFRKARKERLKARTRIQRDTRTEILRLLRTARDEITQTLAGTPSDFQQFQLPQIKKSIERTMTTFGDGAGAAMRDGANQAWQGGIDLIDKPIEAGGVAITALLPEIDPRQLQAMRTFMTDKMGEISTEVMNKINSELGLIAIGAQSSGDAIGKMAKLMGSGRKRAVTVVRTELGRAFSVASHARQTQAKEIVPGLKKQWRRSGKIHSRLHHDAADGQVKEIEEPFVLSSKKGPVELMFPRDPAAPVGEVVNCGCESLPFMENWEVKNPQKKPFTDLELQSKTKQEIATSVPLNAVPKKAARVLSKKPTTYRASRDKNELKIVGRKTEKAIAFDEDGTVLFEKVGGKSSITFTRKELLPLRGKVVTHNHPRGTSFSPEDIKLAADFGFAEMRAVGSNYAGVSHRYSMRPPDSGWSEDFWKKTVEPAVKRHHAAETNRAASAILAGKIKRADMADVDFEHWHRVWRAVARETGIKYSRRVWKTTKK